MGYVAPATAPANPRRSELGLLLLAMAIIAGGYVLASLGRASTLPANLLPFLIIVLALLLGAHLATRWLAPRADGTLLALAGLLNGLGYIVVARLDHQLAALQAVWTGVGIAAYVLTLLVVRRTIALERYRYLFGLSGIGLLLMPLLPVIGRNINGARLWIRIGPLTFQPVEMAKIALAVFFASYIVEKTEVLSMASQRWGSVLVPDLRQFGPVVLAAGLSLVIMTAERDIGFSLLFLTLFVSMLWMATGRLAYLGLGAVLFVGGGFAASRLFTHVHDRIQVWVNPWPHANAQGYQIIQAMYAFAAGGVAGTGLGLGSPQRIPVVASDFIFAAIGEELGLVGTLAILTAFLLLIGAGLRVALAAHRPFDKLLAAGLTAAMGFQAFYILAGVTRLLPLTGVTLPFVSYGGSSLVANYVLIALLVRISHQSAEREAGVVELPASATG